MDIVKHKADDVVVYAGESLELTASGLRKGKLFSPVITTEDFIKQVVSAVPADFRGNWYTCDVDGAWAYTQYGADQAAAAAAEAAAAEAARLEEEGNKTNLRDDATINFFRTKTMAQITAEINNDFSAIADMSDAAIVDYIKLNLKDPIDVMANLDDARIVMDDMANVLEVLAKDMASALKLLKVTSRISIYLLKQQL